MLLFTTFIAVHIFPCCRPYTSCCNANFYFFSPPFVQIDGFYVSYDELYESLKPRGKLDNNVMTLWTYQFNHDEADAWADDNSIIKKYAFSSNATVKDSNQF